MPVSVSFPAISTATVNRPGRHRARRQVGATGPGCRAAGHGGFDARGSRVRGSADFRSARQSLSASVGRVGHPAARGVSGRAAGKGEAEPRTRTARTRSRGPRPVPPSSARSCLVVGLGGGPGLVVGVGLVGLGLGGRWSWVVVVGGRRVVRGRSVGSGWCVVVVGRGSVRSVGSVVSGWSGRVVVGAGAVVVAVMSGRTGSDSGRARRVRARGRKRAGKGFRPERRGCTSSVLLSHSTSQTSRDRGPGRKEEGARLRYYSATRLVIHHATENPAGKKRVHVFGTTQPLD
jgi:hypothetical protein